MKLLRFKGFVYREARTIHDLTPEYLQDMQANDWVKVYHATGIDSRDRETGPQNMVFGIDALGKQRSHYHPDTSGGHSYQGLYVGPTKESVGQFGRLVFEFVVKARNLHATDWSGNISRRWEKGQGTWQGDDLVWLKQKCVDQYPFSFNALLSGALDPAARADTCGSLIRALEPQALFVGIVPAKDILAVHYIDTTHTPAAFIEQYQGDLGWTEQQTPDPKSTRLTWDDYVELMQDKFGGRKDMQQIAQTLFLYRLLYDEHKVFEMLGQFAPFSRPSAEKFWKMLQQRYCNDFIQVWQDLSEKRPDIKMERPRC